MSDIILAATVNDLTPELAYQAVRESETSGNPYDAALMALATSFGLSNGTLTIGIDESHAVGAINLANVPATTARIDAAIRSRVGFAFSHLAFAKA